MKILIINDNQYSSAELKDFAKISRHELIVVNSVKAAIKSLQDKIIDAIIIKVKSLKDIGFLKFMNDNFPFVQILLYAENNFNEAISIIKQSNFTKIKDLNNFVELNTQLNKLQNIKEKKL